MNRLRYSLFLNHNRSDSFCFRLWTSKGFTLLELLVVIAIIVVLLAILVPALDSAISLAEEAKCKTNLKNTYKGFVGFSLDHKTNLPGAFITFWDSRGSWVGTEAGYQGKQVEGGSELSNLRSSRECHW